MKKALILAPIIAGALGFAHMGGLETELARAPYVRQSLENIGLRQDRYSSMSPEELVSNVKDWNQAEDYLMKHFSYSLDDLGYPKSSYGNINEIHSAKKGNCSVGATMASMLINRTDNYEGYVLTLDKRKWLPKIKGVMNNHEICIVRDKKTEKYGSLGINKKDCIAPIYDSKEKVLAKINTSFLGMFDIKESLETRTRVYGPDFKGYKIIGVIK